MTQRLIDFLSNLTDAEVEAVVTHYKRFQDYEDFVQDSSIDDLDDLDWRIVITKLLTFSGCIYDSEIEAYLKCLKRELELYRQGCTVFFDLNLWENLMHIEELFGVSL